MTARTSDSLISMSSVPRLSEDDTNTPESTLTGSEVRVLRVNIGAEQNNALLDGREIDLLTPQVRNGLLLTPRAPNPAEAAPTQKQCYSKKCCILTATVSCMAIMVISVVVAAYLAPRL